MKNICVIPARGGSKRIPRKNIKLFLGKPIISYSIEAAIKSKLFDEVMVSTDDKEIAEIATQFGASVPFLRSEKNSGDMSGTVEVLLEVLGNYNLKGQEFNNLCCVYPTAPFVTSGLLVEGLKKMISTNSESLVPIAAFGYPPQRGFHINRDSYISYVQPENAYKRSQDLEKMYHDVGLFYWMDVKSLMKNKSILTKNTSYILMPQLQVQDIDNEEDWEIAEFKFKFNNRIRE